jgi:hypothetical protein
MYTAGIEQEAEWNQGPICTVAENIALHQDSRANHPACGESILTELSQSIS